jgi:hypothetical protein
LIFLAELIEYINPPQVLSLNEMEANKMFFGKHISKAAVKAFNASYLPTKVE